MNKQSILAQLHDIKMPEPVDWWPLAPGWYLLILLCIGAICILSYYLIKHYSFGRAKREALNLLAQYQKDFNADNDTFVAVIKISKLLKRVALAYFPRRDVAGLYGIAWIMFLNNTSSQLDFNTVAQELLEHPYHQKPAQSITLLFTLTRKWIKQRGAPCLN